MKRTVSIILSVILLISLIPGASLTDAPELRELTILAYICGTDLESQEGEATGDISEMIASGVGNSGSVTAVIATGGSSGWQRFGISSRNVQYYRIGKNGLELTKDVGSRNMGSAETLSDFLSYAISAAPAKRYILILWDHGGGPVFGICNDENYRDDSLSLAELRTALQRGLNGVRLDLIGFDCCLMNCVDLCSDMYGIADHAVLSQELVSGTGFNYDEWIARVVRDPMLPTKEIAVSIADTYVAENARGRNATTATMSVVSMDQMPAVMEAANAFSASLNEAMKDNFSGVVRLRSQLISFGEFMDYDASDLVDVEDMCKAFSSLLPSESEKLRQAARAAVSYNITTSDISSYAHGLSFFLPHATVRNDRQEILEHYAGENSAYANLAVALTNQASSSGYTMSASSYQPSNFYSYDDYYGSASCSGDFCDIWDGYYGDYCSFEDAYDYCEGNIWAGFNSSGGSIWDGFATSTGIWSGYSWNESASSSGETVSSGIWAGLGDETTVSGTSAETQFSEPFPGITNIWSGLLNSGNDYYQPGEDNQNLQPGISEAASADSVLEAVNEYFASATLSSQMVYSIQLNKTDLNNLASASGALSVITGDETVRLGNIGSTKIDWSTGLVFSMFDGSWPMLEGQMVRAEFLYADESGNTRFVIPAKINGLKMYLLGNFGADGKTAILGATQGYDENGFAIRGAIPLEAGTIIYPLFTAVTPDGSEREYEGEAVIVPESGLSLSLSRIPAGKYQYSFALTDLSGAVHYTNSVTIDF